MIIIVEGGIHMKKSMKKIVRMLLATMILAVCLISGSPSEAMSGEWKKDRKGWYYSYSDGTYAKSCWKKLGGKWYHFDAKGYMQTGWVKDGGKWYYCKPSSGSMQTGWKKIGKHTYFFKADGSMASNEYCQGYWLNKDGSWTVKAKGSWKKKGGKWWYGDTSGWYAKSRWLKIDNKEYYFFSDGYMASNWWIDGYYLKAGGAYVKGMKKPDWPGIYLDFLNSGDYVSKVRQPVEQADDLSVCLFDIDHNGIPELLFTSFASDASKETYMNYIYTCASGKVEYVGMNTNGAWMYQKNAKNPKGILMTMKTVYPNKNDYNNYYNEYYSYTMEGKTITAKKLSDHNNSGNQSLADFSVDAMKKQLPAYQGIMDEEDPVLLMDDLNSFLFINTFFVSEYDYRSDEPYPINLIPMFDVYPVDPTLYSDHLVYQGKMKEKTDPRNRFGTYYSQLNGAKTEWILRNVFNCSDQTAEELRQIDDGSERSAYYQNGSYYIAYGEVCSGGRVTITGIQKINSLYKISFEKERTTYTGESYGLEKQYAVLERKSTGKTDYWSMYILDTSDISDATVKSIQKKESEKLP